MNPWMNPFGLYAALLLLLAGQLPADQGAYQRVSWDYDLPEHISPAGFSVCSQHDCRTRVQVSLDPPSWARIERRFIPLAASAAEERAQVAGAIGLMEQLVADVADTHHDKGGDFNGLGEPGSQLDCVDESVNTTTYLTLFQQQGLLRRHRVLHRTSRGYLFFGGWPHFTAVIEDRDTGKVWVVDSWFRDNGAAADILPVGQWRKGWSPEEFSM